MMMMMMMMTDAEGTGRRVLEHLDPIQRVLSEFANVLISQLRISDSSASAHSPGRSPFPLTHPRDTSRLILWIKSMSFAFVR